jgi:hypothetical protein
VNPFIFRGPAFGAILRSEVHRDVGLHPTQRRRAARRHPQADEVEAGATRVRREREEHRISELEIELDSSPKNLESASHASGRSRHPGSSLHQFEKFFKVLRKLARSLVLPT